MLQIKHITPQIVLALLDLEAFLLKEPKLNKRQLESKGIRFLLEQLFPNVDVELAYTEQNKPYLKNRGEHISISHSHDKLVLLLNKTENTGVDIELIRDKVSNIQHKFLTPEELVFVGTNIERMITFWAAKEALYKVYGLKGLDFTKNLFVKELNEKELEGIVLKETYKKKYKLHCETIDNYKLVYILNEI